MSITSLRKWFFDGLVLLAIFFTATAQGNTCGGVVASGEVEEAVTLDIGKGADVPKVLTISPVQWLSLTHGAIEIDEEVSLLLQLPRQLEGVESYKSIRYLESKPLMYKDVETKEMMSMEYVEGFDSYLIRSKSEETGIQSIRISANLLDSYHRRSDVNAENDRIFFMWPEEMSKNEIFSLIAETLKAPRHRFRDKDMQVFESMVTWSNSKYPDAKFGVTVILDENGEFVTAYPMPYEGLKEIARAFKGEDTSEQDIKRKNGDTIQDIEQNIAFLYNALIKKKGKITENPMVNQDIINNSKIDLSLAILQASSKGLVSIMKLPKKEKQALQRKALEIKKMDPIAGSKIDASFLKEFKSIIKWYSVSDIQKLKRGALQGYFRHVERLTLF